MDEIITVKNLNKTYGQKPAVKDLSFSVSQGEIVGLLGPNGAGKSTTINILSQVSAEIAYDSFLPDQLTAKEINTILKDIYKNWDETYYWELVKRFDLPNDKRLRKFSSGMKMKMKIVAALSHHPKLLLLDEPTSGLDPLVRSDILDIFKDFVKGGEIQCLLKGKVIYMSNELNNQDMPNTWAIPDDTIDTLARCLLPKIQAYFDSPEGQAEFEEWKREHENA